MKKKISDNVIKYICCFSVFSLLSFTCEAESLSLSALCGLLYADISPFLSVVAYISSLAIDFSLTSFMIGSLESIILCCCFLFYKNKKPKAEIIIYLLLALCPYAFATRFTLKKAVYMAIIVVFSPICQSAIHTAEKKILSKRLTVSEAFSLSLFTVALGLGAIKANLYLPYKLLCVSLILFAGTLVGKDCVLLSAILAFPIALSTGDYAIIAPFIVYACVCLAFLPYSKILTAIGIIGAELFFVYLTNVYHGYSYVELAFTVGGVLPFIALPKSVVEKLKEKTNFQKGKSLSRQIVNRFKMVISDRLYELSYLFAQVNRSITSLQLSLPSEEQATEQICSEVLSKVCSTCPVQPTCRSRSMPDREKLNRLAKIGLAKGKLSLVDIPADFTKYCPYVGNLLSSINGNLAFYKDKLNACSAFKDQSDVVCLQANTFSTVAKELANTFGKTLAFETDRENAILKKMQTQGIFPNEILCFGSGDESEIWLIVNKLYYDEYKISKTLSDHVGYEVFPFKTQNLSKNQICVCYKKAPPLDAVFGLKQVCKKGNSVSGDTHSLFKINEGKFVCALSDGMGSGKTANKVSSLTLDTMECFFSAGINCSVTVKTLDKLLSIASPEAFTALDLCLVDLYEGNAEFIKIGAPYGYIISPKGIKTVEGSSLPLGSNGQCEQKAGKAKLLGGELLVFVTDGVSDAFGSSLDLMDYLKSVKTKNPQSLAESVVNKALSLEGEAADDLSCLCVKIFKRNNC